MVHNYLKRKLLGCPPPAIIALADKSISVRKFPNRKFMTERQRPVAAAAAYTSCTSIDTQMVVAFGSS
jgi:hypothetical protein